MRAVLFAFFLLAHMTHAHAGALRSRAPTYLQPKCSAAFALVLARCTACAARSELRWVSVAGSADERKSTAPPAAAAAAAAAGSASAAAASGGGAEEGVALRLAPEAWLTARHLLGAVGGRHLNHVRALRLFLVSSVLSPASCPPHVLSCSHPCCALRRALVRSIRW